MEDVKNTKRRFFGVILGILLILFLASGTGGREGRGGGGREFSGNVNASPRSVSSGDRMRAPSGFAQANNSRADSFSRGRASDMPSVRSERMSTPPVGRGESFRGSSTVGAERSVATAPRSFRPDRRADSGVSSRDVPRVSRESVAQPITRSVETRRAPSVATASDTPQRRREAIASPIMQSRNTSKAASSVIKTAEPSSNVKVADSASSRPQIISAPNRRQALVAARADRMRSIMKPIDASETTTANAAAPARRASIAGRQTTISGNRDIAGNLSASRNWSGSRQQGNWGHGDWWHRHNHHRHFNNNVFVVVGGFWPSYWWWNSWYPYYGYPYYWHPYYYGYPYPYYGYGASIWYPIGGNTYNYYNYNYDTTGALQPGSIVDGVEVPNYSELSAVNKKGVPETQSDKLFDDGVQAFGKQDYATASAKLQEAVRLEPDDTILPFAYAQALFANNQYEQAAAVISTTLSEMSPRKAEISYPRGMYKDDNILNMQIKNLERAVLMDPTNTQLQLLYGYQLLGIGKIDEARVALTVAKRDARTSAAATALLDVMERAQQKPGATQTQY